MEFVRDLLIKFTSVGIIATLRYFIFAGILYFLFYIWKRTDWHHIKIQTKFPKPADISREIKYSLLTMLIFAFVGTGLFVLRKNGYTLMYLNISDYGVPYFIGSVVAMIFLHDTYFYWMHRFMHWKAIYPYVHKIHHLSTNPTPWAAFAFHPLEAVAEIAILPIAVFLIPLHPFAILSWVLYMTLLNVVGHLGYELFPRGFTKGTVTKWHNTSTHHNMHHKHVTCNYGLYFNFWDRVMGTNHAHYDEQFEAVIERRNQKNGDLENSSTPVELANN